VAAGRCAGCGRTGSLRKITQHMVSCSDFIDLFGRDPAKALDPEAEYDRYRAEERNAEARAHQRGERLAVRFAEINRQQAASASRWAKPPDILD
jgi:hypothetical protein